MIPEVIEDFDSLITGGGPSQRKANRDVTDLDKQEEKKEETPEPKAQQN